MKKEDEKKTTKKAKTEKIVKAEKVVKDKDEKELKETEKQIKKDTTILSIIELIAIIIAIVIILVFFPNTVIWNIVVLLLILTVLVFVHEGGHFMAAKKCGVHVYEFALGMGPKVLGFNRKNDPTDYSLRCLPIGGYCQMAGEEGEDDENLPKDKFMCNKNKRQRLLILVAGVCMNFITAIILLFFVSLIWGSTNQSNTIGFVQENSPASEAGLVVGDKILSYNGHKVSRWDQIALYSAYKETQNRTSYTYEIEHEDGTVETYEITPKEYVYINNGKDTVEITDEYTVEQAIKDYNLDKKTTSSKLIGLGTGSKRNKGFGHAIKYAFTKFWSLFTSMFAIVWALITGKIGITALSGPVGMYTVVNTAAAAGLANIIYLAAYLSINLGVINILPFPAFDGGRVLFVFIEAVTGKKVDAKVEGMFHTIGFILLMILMLVITGHDIANIL